MAISANDYYKAKVEEYTAVADAIRLLMGQPVFGSQDYDSTNDAYEWTTDYIAKLTQIKTILGRLNNIIGGDVTGDGPVDEIKEKIEDVQERINDIIDPSHTQRDDSIEDVIDDIGDLVDRLDDIVDGDPTQPTGDTPAELIGNIEDNKETLEEIIDPDFDPTTDDRPLDDVVNDIKDAIDDIREIVPDPEQQPGEPDERTLDEVVEDINDIVDIKEELENLIGSIEEIIHQVAVYTGEEDPDTYYYVVVDGLWEPIDESQIDPSIYTEEAEIDFQPAEGDEAGQDYNDYTAYSFTEDNNSVKDYFDDKAEEIYELMEEEELDWEDLTDDQKLIITIDDLLDYIESLEAEVDEYRNGGFQLIETSSAVSGSGIFDTIQNLETARRATMTEEQKEEEKTVVYISRCLFNTTESFICTGLIDGVRKNGAFFYRDSATNNFYNTSAPTSNAKLGAGKYLIRVILREEAYFNAEI